MNDYPCEIGITVRRLDIMFPEKLLDLLNELDLLEGLYLYEDWLDDEENAKLLKSPDELLQYLNKNRLLLDAFIMKLRKDNQTIWIKNPQRVAGTTLFAIGGQMLKSEIELYKSVLLSHFGDKYYNAYVSSYIYYDNEKFRYLYHQGINLIVSKIMYFGKYMFDFIPKEKLLSYKYAYRVEEINGNVYVQLVKNLYNIPKWLENRKIKQFIRKMKVKELENYVEGIMNWDTKLKIFQIPSHEDYSKEYVEQKLSNFKEKNKKPVNNYTIEIIDELSIVLKKYKKTHFYYVEESMNAMEVVAFFIYTPDGEEPDYHIHDVKAHFEVEISCVSPSVEEYAQRNRYSLECLEDKHYLLKKEDEKEISIINHYINDKYEIEYDLRLTIQKESFNMKEIKSMINEYERMVKYAKLKEK